MDLPEQAQAVLDGRQRWCILAQDSALLLDGLSKAVFDHTITDPGYDDRTHKGARAHAANVTEMSVVAIDIDFDPTDPACVVNPCLRVTRRWTLAFCSFEMVGGYAKEAKGAWVRTGIYRRTNGAPQFTGDRPAQAGEAIAIMHRPKVRKRWNGHGKAGCWEAAVEHEKDRHPTQKPLGLMKDLIADFTDPDDIIFDPFCGHGTTGVAALLAGRRFVGVELKPKYAIRASARCRKAEQQWRDAECMRQTFEIVMEEDRQTARDIFNLVMEE
jgi:site-specific DNA-methyltransferase (adenine-specific)